ncbi:MAG: hypothetical protein ACK41C_01440 [Phenylobacterium sp.]|jgi:bifunctional DNA-binding transcriptional regulator/antitoxin component of YhaV-PrlF toxin-antitoxin module|uniref:hypothetical protein n=1 Tax=Phenylobacterium sp. TaxID=1871053 RepID=UPI00391DA1F8
MIALKLERMGSDVVLVFDAATRKALNLEVGDTVHVQRTADGVIAIGEHDTDHEARVARGKAFLKRYRRSFENLAGS